MTKFARAQAALIRRQKAANPATITYQRGVETAAVTGWFGRGLAVNLTDQAARIQVSDREFFLSVADLTTAGFTEPQIGDQLTVDGETGSWEIVPVDTGEAAFRFSDSERTFYRIHTVLVP